jgi:hypothetical protein
MRNSLGRISHHQTNLVVALKVLADSDGLLDEVVEVLGDLGGETCQVTLIETNGSMEEIIAWNTPLARRMRRILVPVRLLT